MMMMMITIIIIMMMMVVVVIITWIMLFSLLLLARRVEAATNEHGLGVLAITHYNRLLEELKPDHVHILVKGRIVESGGPDLADRLERDGYEAFANAEEAADEPAGGGSYDDLFAM